MISELAKKVNASSQAVERQTFRIFSIKMAFWKDDSCQYAGTKDQRSYTSTACKIHLLFLLREFYAKLIGPYNIEMVILEGTSGSDLILRDYGKCSFLWGEKKSVLFLDLG